MTITGHGGYSMTMSSIIDDYVPPHIQSGIDMSTNFLA